MGKTLTPKLSFIYRICNDVDEMRMFYSEIMGLKEITYSKEGQGGWVVYDCNGLTVQFWQWDEKIPVDKEWSWQPGNWEGDSTAVSWAIEVDEEQMEAIFEKMKSNGIKMFHGKPKWFADNKYWGLKAKDPMGFTVDIHYSPESEPEITEWER